MLFTRITATSKLMSEKHAKNIPVDTTNQPLLKNNILSADESILNFKKMSALVFHGTLF
jgi:hypothetical protein